MVHNDFLYVIGGWIEGVGGFKDVQYTRIYSDGSVGAWSLTTSFSQARGVHTSVVQNDYLYIIGGYGGNDVQYAKFLP